MAVGGSGLSALFWVEPITPGDVASWLTDGVLKDGGSGGGSLSIGASIVGGTSPAVLFIGPGNVLAQDPTNFTFDDTNFILKIGHSGTSTAAYWVNGFPGLYGIPNASGNNWFEANAGNTTLTGFLNFGTGDSALASLTTGNNNVAIGGQALNVATTASQNLSLGSGSLAVTAADTFNTAIGYFALHTLGFSGAGGGGNSGNIALGYASISNMQIGSNNIGIGSSSLLNLVSGNNIANIAIGPSAAGSLGSTGVACLNNVFIGPSAGSNYLGGSNNTYIGGWKGYTGSRFGNSPGNTIGISDGNPTWVLDMNLTNAWIWSFNANTAQGVPVGIHVYNTQDTYGQAVNYERGVFDWTNNTAPNNILTIGTQAGGTGTVRNIKFVGGTVTFPAAAPIIPTSTVAGLPAAGTAGRRATVTDSTVFTFGNIVVGGGTDTVPVYDDGTNWRIG